ncbi:hypothetical protein F5X99DRAFT_388918 [Biscogniauxia marginata]|nr:hypothetical protein F5X99DRAFT_388918 [Biscogniauxia marginata]
MDQDDTNGRDSRDIKGKGKDLSSGTEDLPAISEPSSEHGPILSRLATSTARLTSELIAHRPDTDYMSDGLLSSKPGTSGVSSSQVAGIGTKEISTHENTSARPNHENTFKSIHVQEHVTREEGFSEFLHHASGLEQIEPRLAETAGPERSWWEADPSQQASHGVPYSINDGMEVVRLLDSDYNEGAIGEVEIPMTSDERLALRQALFPGDGKKGRAWEGMLNFVPEFISNDKNGTADAVLSEHLGISNPEEARDIWINQWQDVLSSYTDEVWGDLSCLVGRAQEELQVLATPRGGESLAGLPALRRLQQILAHVRRS